MTIEEKKELLKLTSWLLSLQGVVPDYYGYSFWRRIDRMNILLKLYAKDLESEKNKDADERTD